MFYNPLTRNTIISNTAEFDERAFPGLSTSVPPPSPPPPTVEPSAPSFVEPEPCRSPRHVLEPVGELPNQVGEEVPAPMPEPVAPSLQPPTPSVSSPPPRRYPAREHRPPQEWWKLPSTSHNYREPTPVVDSSDEEPSSNDSAEESLHAEVEWSSYLEVPEAFECVFKVGAHSNDPKTLAEAMARPNGDQ